MNIKPLKTFQTANYELSKVMGYTKEFASQFMENPFLLGAVFELAITTASVSFDHKLGKTPTGWIVTDKDANADIWRVSWDETTITLDASASANIKIWVF